MSIDLAQLRREFSSNGISYDQLCDSPFMQFELWINQATEAGLILPNAMSLATADASEVSIRTVLLKSFDAKGFVFFTNYSAKKSKQIAHNAKVALLFPWLPLERQVKISGTAEKISTFESAKYFATRPKQSQLGAWASRQSLALNSRKMLLSQFEAIKAKFAKGEVPLPDFWGGYLVIPHSIEFWQGRENRLHDRFVYKKQQNNWVISRLSP